MNDKTYIIVNRSDVTQEWIENAIQTSLSTLRMNSDLSKAILKWRGETPDCFKGIKTYNHEEILKELRSDE